jgi:hypothetical protein
MGRPIPMRMEQACCRWSSAAVADDESQVLFGVCYSIMYFKALQPSVNLDPFLNMTQLYSNMLDSYVFYDYTGSNINL